MKRLARSLLCLGLVALACNGAEPHGHDHGAEASEPEPLSVTTWTERHELFVEFPAPVAGKPVEYHAHVTDLAGFTPLTEGTFRVRYKSGANVVAEAKVEGVKRAGIFTPEGPAPAAGRYQLEMVVERAGTSDVFDCGTVEVRSAPPKLEPEAPSGALTFLKESQWKIPFGTARADERPLAKEIELPGTVEPAGADQLVVGAPTGGRFFHNPKVALAEGSRIKKGDVIGSIAPNVAGEDFSRLQLAVEEARLSKEQVEREIARVEPLVKQDLLPERRLIELRNERDTLSARLSSARGRVGRVLAPGGAGGLPIKSTLEGVVSELLVPNGEPVEAGAPLVRIGGTSSLWVRTRFVARPASELSGAQAAGVRLPSGERLDLEAAGGRLLSTLPAIDPESRIATWIVEVPRPAGAPSLASLQPGVQVVLVVSVGAPRTTLAVPREAVVEIDTRPYVFVQVNGEHFEKRAVRLGVSHRGFVEVLSGVQKGERLVTKGGFDIHLASLMGTVESHRH